MLLKASGTDATQKFDSFHSPSVLEKYGDQLLIGEIGSAGAEEEEEEVQDSNPLTVGETFGDMVPFGDPMW